MTVRVGINGFGRIGRDVLRSATEHHETAIEIVAVNDLTTPDTLAHLLSFASTYGPWSHAVAAEWTTLAVDRRPIAVNAEYDPAKLDWGSPGVDVVIEATGRFRTREAADAHLARVARKVLITAPGKRMNATIVMGSTTTTTSPTSTTSCPTHPAPPTALPRWPGCSTSASASRRA